jgi:hypothetical protein
MTPRDTDAMRRAIEMVRTLDVPEIADAVDRMLKTESWSRAGTYAAYHAQIRSLRLRPWMCPPCDANDAIDPAEGDHYGNKPGEVGLRQRLIALDLSVLEPDPLAAIEAATAKSENANFNSDLPAEPVT